MMTRHFRLSSELTGAIAKRLPHAKNQLSGPDSFFNQFVTYIYIYIYTSALRLLALRGSADLPSGRLEILEKQYVAFLFCTKYAGLSFVYGSVSQPFSSRGTHSKLTPFSGTP